MDPATGYAVAGGLSALGSIGASLVGSSSAKQQQRFQKRMSNTAHQREMADLEKAGLNPLLTGKYGGSSTPPGTSFTPSNPAEQIPQAHSAYQQLKQSKPLVHAQVNQATANTANVVAQTQKTEAETKFITANTAMAENKFPLELDKIIQDTETSGTTSAKNLSEIKKNVQELKKLIVTRKIYDEAGNFLPQASRLIDKLEALGVKGVQNWKDLFQHIKRSKPKNLRRTK